MHGVMIWPNELWVCISPIVDARALDVLWEETPGVVKVSELLGMQLSPGVKCVHVLLCPSDSEIWRVIAMVGARHDLNPVNPVLECLDTCLELQEQEHDLPGDPLHAD